MRDVKRLIYGKNGRKFLSNEFLGALFRNYTLETHLITINGALCEKKLIFGDGFNRNSRRSGRYDQKNSRVAVLYDAF